LIPNDRLDLLFAPSLPFVIALSISTFSPTNLSLKYKQHGRNELFSILKYRFSSRPSALIWDSLHALPGTLSDDIKNLSSRPPSKIQSGEIQEATHLTDRFGDFIHEIIEYVFPLKPQRPFAHNLLNH
jgi:hypothetical protein